MLQPKQFDGYSPGKYNLNDEILKQIPDISEQVVICDETLREGEESPGVYMSPTQKLQIARKLDEIGIQEVMIGYPGIIPEHAEFIKTIKKEGLRFKPETMVRTHEPDWKRQVDTVVDLGLDRVRLPVALDETFRALAPPMSLDESLDRYIEAIKYAKGKGLIVSAWPADPPKVEWPLLRKWYQAAIQAGIDRITVSDATSLCTPRGVNFLIGKIKKLTGDTVKIGVHFHNDMGLATANTIAAFEAGAEIADCVVNGLGDRAGNAPLEEVVAGCEILYGIKTGITVEKLFDVSKLVQDVSKIVVQPNKPIVGASCFVHSADTHVRSIYAGQPAHTESFPPNAVGQKRLIFYGTSTRKQSLVLKAKSMGLTLTDTQQDLIMKQLKQIHETKDYATEEQVEGLIQQATGHAK